MVGTYFPKVPTLWVAPTPKKFIQFFVSTKAVPFKGRGEFVRVFIKASPLTLSVLFHVALHTGSLG